MPITPRIASGASIATFMYGNTQGFAAIIGTLNSGTHGITVNEWYGPTEGQKSHWMSGQTPPVMNIARAYKTIATNAFKDAFALVDGVHGSEIWQSRLSADLKTWSKVGRVQTGS